MTATPAMRPAGIAFRRVYAMLLELRSGAQPPAAEHTSAAAQNFFPFAPLATLRETYLRGRGNIHNIQYPIPNIQYPFSLSQFAKLQNV